MLIYATNGLIVPLNNYKINWRKRKKKIPCTEFNYHFWTKCNPKRSTCLAGRVDIVIKNQNPDLEQTIIKIIM